MNSRRLQLLTLVLLAFAGAAFAAGDQDKTTKPDAAAQVASADAGNTNQSGAPVLKQRNSRYQLQKGDVLVLDFPFTPEYNETVTVQPDGFVALRGIGDMHVEGMSTPEMQDNLRTAYTKILHDPVVTVTPQTFVSPYFIAYGEVSKPGKYDIHGDTTVAQAIGMAGGFTKDAKHSQVYLFRRVNDEWVSSQKVDLKHMLKSGNLSEDLHMQPGDMLWVPKNLLSKVLEIQPLIPYNAFRLNFGPY